MSTDPRKFVSGIATEVRSRHYDPNKIEASENAPFLMDPDVMLPALYAPKTKFFIYNVGPMEFIVPKGSGGPPGGFVIVACEKAKMHSKPLEVPALVSDTYLDAQTGQIKAHWMRGEDLCQDIVHPMNGRMWSVGQNLDDFGVFWTKHNPPLEKELELAREKMEITFRAALAEAGMLEATGRLDLITPLMRHAASWFEEDREWNRQYKKVLDCPACGQPMKANIAVHSCGAVIDWARAIFHGVRTFQQAKDSDVFTPDLEKEVADLRSNKRKADEAAARAAEERANRPAGEEDLGGSFLSASEIEAHEGKNAAELGKVPIKSNLPELAEQPGTPPATKNKRSHPAPKRPANFREK